jgi:hypothetical protein
MSRAKRDRTHVAEPFDGRRHELRAGDVSIAELALVVFAPTAYGLICKQRAAESSTGRDDRRGRAAAALQTTSHVERRAPQLSSLSSRRGRLPRHLLAGFGARGRAGLASTRRAEAALLPSSSGSTPPAETLHPATSTIVESPAAIMNLDDLRCITSAS